MARIRLRFVNSFVNKNRKDSRVRYYFRRPGVKAVPLPGIPGDEQFMSAYHAALAGISNAPVEIGASRTTPGTVDALVVNYYKSAAWLDLAEDSRSNRRGLIERFRERHGAKRVSLLRRDHFEKMLAEMTVGPGMKGYWIKTIRAVLKSGIPSMIAADPTAGIIVKRGKTPGHRPWTVEQIEQYRRPLAARHQGAAGPGIRLSDHEPARRGLSTRPAAPVPRPERRVAHSDRADQGLA
jgi:hypothetical protein